MFKRLVWNSIYLSTVVILFFLSASPLYADDPVSELSARTLLGEAEKLIECSLLQDALFILDRIKSEYPGTEAAAFADLRKAQCYFFLKRYDDAINTAAPIVANNPGTVLAAWAQSILGQCLVDKGQVVEGIRELKKVEEMVDPGSEVGPLNESREVLGRLCLAFLSGRSDDMDAVEYLGWSRSDSKACAKLLAILAAYRARKGQIDSAKSTVARLQTEYASETSEITWARTEVAMYEAESGRSSESMTALNDAVVSSASGLHQSAKAALALARSHIAKKEFSQAADILRGAAEKPEAQKNPEMPRILYELGNTLCRQGRVFDGSKEGAE